MDQAQRIVAEGLLEAKAEADRFLATYGFCPCTLLYDRATGMLAVHSGDLNGKRLPTRPMRLPGSIVRALNEIADGV